MKKNWRSNNLLICILLFFMMVSCRHKEEKEHTPGSGKVNLNGLLRSPSETVAGDLRIIAVDTHSVVPQINAYGHATYDPSDRYMISAKFPGRIEKIFIRSNFQMIRKGQHIMDVYSPELNAMQQDLLLLLSKSDPDLVLVEQSRSKLIRSGFATVEIEKLMKTRTVVSPIPVYSPFEGHVHQSTPVANKTTGTMDGDGMQEKSSSASKDETQFIREGMYLQKGQELFTLYGMKNVWVILDIHASDAPYLKVGMPVTLTPENGGKPFVSRLSAIETIGQESASTTVRARIYLEGREQVRPGEIVKARIESTELYGIFVPRNAVVDLGRQQVVFRKMKFGFIAQEVETGFRNDSLIQIVNGLEKRDSIAVNAQFLVDSESFIAPKELNKNK